MVDQNKNRNIKSIEQINAQFGKIPPQAIDVEEAVLGALMLERDAIHQVSDIIDTQSFYKNEHQKIFEAIKTLSRGNKEVDLLMVTQELKKQNILEEVGGPMKIMELTSRVASAAHIEFHARVIADKFLQRELIRVSSEIQVKAYDESIDLDDLLNDAKSSINDVDSFTMSANLGQYSNHVATEALRELEKDCVATRSGISPGIPTGFDDLNRALGGWRNTNLIILAARPSVGKSSLALHFAITAALQNYWVNFYGLEMKNHDYFRILLSGLTGISRTDIRDGRLEQDDWKKIHDATAILEKLPIIWNDNPGITANNVRANTIRNKRAGKCSLVIIDYLQLMKPADKKAIREQQIADMTRTLKETCLSEDVPIIALSQLNRDVEKRSDKEPNLSDLRESGAIEQDADVVLFLWDHENPKLKIGKNRRGKIGPVDFWSNSEKTSFGDREPTVFDYKLNTGITPQDDEPKQNDLPF